MTRLEQAIQNYPPGTVFRSAYSKDQYTIPKTPRIYLEKSSYAEDGVRIQIGSNNIWIYYHGKWAEIIESPIKKEENYLLFPI